MTPSRGLIPSLSLVTLVGFGLLGFLAQGCEAPKEPQAAGPVSDHPDAGPVAAGGLPVEPESRDPAHEGKWRQARHAAPKTLSEEQARLLVLPYLQGYRPAGDEPQITVFDPERTEPGLNLVLSGHAPEALLTDLRGRVVHRWSYRLETLWPDLYAQDAGTIRKLEYWRRALLLPDGSLLAIFEGLGLIHLDARSRLQWAHRGGIHHDLARTPEGHIWVLDRDGKLLPRIHPSKGVLEDFATQFDADGVVLRRISLLEALERSAHAGLLERRPEAGDILHTNTLELLDGRYATSHPAFAAGNLLVSFRELDAIAILDPVRAQIVWALSGSFRRQHDPALVDGGRILLFDNQGPLRGPAAVARSRLLELTPRTGEVVWQYGGSREIDFFSRTLGASHRLSNGNTLIVESENGRAFEVTRAGDLVWEFYNPHRAGDDQELIAVLFDVVRLSADHPFVGRALAASHRLQSEDRR